MESVSVLFSSSVVLCYYSKILRDWERCDEAEYLSSLKLITLQYRQIPKLYLFIYLLFANDYNFEFIKESIYSYIELCGTSAKCITIGYHLQYNSETI